MKFTSGVTPADLLVASMAAEPFSSMYLWTGIGGAQNQVLLCCCWLTVWDQAEALPTELCWLSLNFHDFHAFVFCKLVSNIDKPMLNVQNRGISGQKMLTSQ